MVENIKSNYICKNCGKKGHFYKNCFNPIISYGIICIKFDEIDLNNIQQLKKFLNNINISDLNDYINNNLKYLLIKRRNSISMLEFIRGKYKLNNLNYILNLFNLMTIDEKNKIKNLSFKNLWYDIWNINDKDDEKYIQEYKNAEKKFNSLKKGVTYKIFNKNIEINLEYIILNSDNRFIESEWGFPKGRKNNINESDINCAIREFNEETNFNINDYKILNFDKHIESYTSINNSKYKHIYFISQIITNNNPCLDFNNKNQINEIGDINWFTYNDSINKLRHYHLEKYNVLNNIHNKIKYLLFYYKKNL